MSKILNTSYTGNKLATSYHRILGRCCYFLDSDHIELSDGTIGDTMKEFTYQDSHPKTVAMIDFKYPGKGLSDRYPAIQYQIHSSENEFKTPIPFFIVVYYLDDHFPIKMFYVIPANVPARAYFDKCELSDRGAWMSVRKFSKFQHALRKQPWNGKELLDDTNLSAIGLAPGTTLSDLSSQVAKYQLPVLDFSWLSREING